VTVESPRIPDSGSAHGPSLPGPPAVRSSGETFNPALSVRERLGPSPQDSLRLHKCSAQTPGFHRVEMLRGAHRHTSTRTRAACSDTTHSPAEPVARHSPAVQEPYRRKTPVLLRLRRPATSRYCCTHASTLPGRSAASAKACAAQIEAAPEKVDRTTLANESRAKLLQHNLR